MDENVSPTVFYAELAGAKTIATEISISSNGETVQLDGKWDTGAYMSCIPWSVVKALRLEPRGIENTHGTFDEVRAQNTYIVDLTITSGYTFKDLRVIGLPEDNPTDYALIGMDIISQGDFLISGYGGGMFSFRVPSTKSISLSFI